MEAEDVTAIVERARRGARAARERIRRSVQLLPFEPELVLQWLEHLDTFDLARSMRVCSAWAELVRTEASLHTSISLPSEHVLMSSHAKRNFTDQALTRLVGRAQGGLTVLRLHGMPQVSLDGLTALMQQPRLHTLSLQGCAGLKFRMPRTDGGSSLLTSAKGRWFLTLLRTLTASSLRTLEVAGLLTDEVQMLEIEGAVWPVGCEWYDRPIKLDVDCCVECAEIKETHCFGACDECMISWRAARRTGNPDAAVFAVPAVYAAVGAQLGFPVYADQLDRAGADLLSAGGPFSHRPRPGFACLDCNSTTRCAKCGRGVCSWCAPEAGAMVRCRSCGCHYCDPASPPLAIQRFGSRHCAPAAGGEGHCVFYNCADCDRAACESCLVELGCQGCGAAARVCRRCVGRGWVHASGPTCRHVHERPASPEPPVVVLR